jgi:Uma2 family endonuclease
MVTTKAKRTARKSEQVDTTAEPRPRLFTVDEYYRMAAARILRHSERTELVEGVILQMAPMLSRHAWLVSRLDRLFQRRLPDTALVRVQTPVHLSTYSEPEPDLAIVRYRDDEYMRGHPEPDDIFLIIEVADTSLAYDRGIKQRMYAVAGIPEYLIFAIGRKQIIAHRKPEGGHYTEISVVERGGTVSLLAFPEIVLSVDEIFG